VSKMQHAACVALLMMGAGGLLGWLAGHTDILFADGLRYIEQARRIDQGAWADGLTRSVDHPIYPMAIAAAHRLDGREGPDGWQEAAQLASVVAGILLVVPLYLVAFELFGASSAWLACLLVYLVPLSGHVMADTLSESTFLLFWTWGVWAALRFLREGRFGWLPPTIGFGALAYLSRPEGLLLPAALVATLLLMPLMRSTRLNWPRWGAAMAFLVLGPLLLVGPYVALKGGLGTKPAVARLLGTAPKSAALAVERERPLDPEQSTAKTYVLAFRAMAHAVRTAVTLPLLTLAVVGLIGIWPPGPRARPWLFMTIVMVAAALALVRLHATGGYCSPRHAMVIALPLIGAAAAGLARILTSLSIPGRLLGLGEGRFRAGPAVWMAVLAGFVAINARELLAPVNAGWGGYRAASEWLARQVNVPPDEWIVDVTGWTLFYGQRPGYTFANLVEAPADPDLRWVVVREAHLHGPWAYCRQIRSLVAGLEPVASFPENPGRQQAVVYIFDRKAKPVQAASKMPLSRRH